MSDLLPCPFCGGQAEIIRFGTPRWSAIVECMECGGRLESGDEGEESGRHWNTRASQWKPIDTAPKDGTKFLIWWPTWNNTAEIGYYSTRRNRFECNKVMYYQDSDLPTHWMPLPEPPKEV